MVAMESAQTYKEALQLAHENPFYSYFTIDLRLGFISAGHEAQHRPVPSLSAFHHLLSQSARYTPSLR